MRWARLIPILTLAAASGCSDITDPQLQQEPQFAMNAAVKTPVTFAMELTGGGELSWKDLGQSGRAFNRDFPLYFRVTGGIEGTAVMMVNANWDEGSWWGTEPGWARTWGTVAINVSGEIWEGNFTGIFDFDPAESILSAQLFSRINLHGPDGQKLKAVCDETSAESEVLACDGEILDPGH